MESVDFEYCPSATGFPDKASTPLLVSLIYPEIVLIILESKSPSQQLCSWVINMPSNALVHSRMPAQILYRTNIDGCS